MEVNLVFFSVARIMQTPVLKSIVLNILISLFFMPQLKYKN